MAFLVAKSGTFQPLNPPEYRPLKPRKTDIASGDFVIDYETELKEAKPQKYQTSQNLQKYQAQQKDFEKKKTIVHAKDIMSKPVHTVDSDSSRSTLVEMMSKYQISHLPVLKDAILVGLISGHDLIIKDENKTSKLMSEHVVTATQDTRIQDIAKIMLNYTIHCLPIIDANNQLVGIITEKDLLRLLAERFQDIFYG